MPILRPDDWIDSYLKKQVTYNSKTDERDDWVTQDILSAMVMKFDRTKVAIVLAAYAKDLILDMKKGLE